MSVYSFYQLDVFTEKAFCGNPLAVFPDAKNLSDEEMQAVAREMNLSETVFVLPSEKALRRLRIFTPMKELPLAGHPVVGTWNLLAQLGVTPQIENGFVKIEQELKLGVLPVEIEFRDKKPFQVVMTQGKFEASEPVSNEREVEKLAESLGLKISDFDLREDLPIQVVSTGIKALAVPLASLEALSRCRINPMLLSEIYLARGAIGCYAFTFETIEKDSRAHARFFAPDDGIAEDAATGSAAGSLSGYLVHHGAIETIEKNVEFTVEQGDFIKRPSRIFAKVKGEKETVEKVKIGGNSIIVAKGEVFF
ncbi:MAG TPA: PhzF family phenazine biosynthesis protein [Pyrinomonadaceae bacterium]|nr:PhzF family phenazine biosynthesis protein [Pyrinomonadaceae bacterium]